MLLVLLADKTKVYPDRKSNRSTSMATNSSNNKTEITLRGSVDIVSDFFFTAINSILYQRGEFQRLTMRSACRGC